RSVAVNSTGRLEAPVVTLRPCVKHIDMLRQVPMVRSFQTLTRITPIPILLRARSGCLRRAFSANFLVLKGFDKITSSRHWYSNSSHRTVVFMPGLSQLLNNLP